MATLKNSKNSAAKSNRRALDRPFAAGIQRKARDRVARYKVVIWFDQEEGEYYGRGLEMPLAMGDGKSPDQCIDSTRAAMFAAAATILEQGRTLPVPSVEGNRSEQINIRLTAEEKLLLEQQARRQGFRGLSDLVRSAILNSLSDTTKIAG